MQELYATPNLPPIVVESRGKAEEYFAQMAEIAGKLAGFEATVRQAMVAANLDNPPPQTVATAGGEEGTGAVETEEVEAGGVQVVESEVGKGGAAAPPTTPSSSSTANTAVGKAHPAPPKLQGIRKTVDKASTKKVSTASKKVAAATDDELLAGRSWTAPEEVMDTDTVE